LFEALIAFLQAISVSDWVVIFLTTKPIFIVFAVVAFVWSRRGRTAHVALPGPDSRPLLESD
jgi:hypothetical protein